MSTLPDVIRAAILAQGKVDPQEIETALEAGVIPEPPAPEPRTPDDERPEAEQLALGETEPEVDWATIHEQAG